MSLNQNSQEMTAKMETENTELIRPTLKQSPQKSNLTKLFSCWCKNSDVSETETNPSHCSFLKDFYFPKRVSLLIVLTLGMTIINAMRVNVGVTVVAILHKTAASKVSNPETMTGISSLQWSSTMVGWLHSMFYLGILVSQVPCGCIVTKCSSTKLYGMSILMSGLLNLLLPTAIMSFGYVSTCVIRLTQGLFEGMIYPSCYDILRIWSLPEEKSRMGATVLTGSYIGPVLGMFFSGVLTHYFGWIYVFYTHGLTIVVWYIFWICLAYTNPSVHPCISDEERDLIATKQGQALIVYEDVSVPWFEISTSTAVWSLSICNFARSSVFYMLLTNQPTYLHLFNFTFAENGLFSSLPHAMMALFCILSGSVADFLLTKPSITTTFVRKLFTCVGFGVEGVFFFGLAVVYSKVLSVTFLTVAVGISGLAVAGWQINHLDIAPRYAGILVAITMTFGTLAGVLNPLIIAALTRDQTLAGWHHVFWLTGGILIFSTIFYLIFGTGERQSWASPKAPNDLDGIESMKPYGTFSGKPPLDGTPNEDGDVVVETNLDKDVKKDGVNGDHANDSGDLKQRHSSISK